MTFDDDDMALGVIAAVGPGGDYLGQRHTRVRCRDFERASIFNRQNYDGWASSGRLSVDEVAARRVVEMLEAYAEPEMDALTRRQLNAYCEQ